MEKVFWICFIFILYTYFVYPLAIKLISLARPHADDYKLLDNDELPKITIVSSIYNGDEYIHEKLLSINNQNYPQDKIKVIFVSDGSTDKTNEILKSISDEKVKSVFQGERKGKPSALNAATKLVETDIIVFTDIRQKLSRNALRHIVSELLSDKRIGAVSGELVHVDNEGKVSSNVGLYWKYEKWIRIAESRYKSMIGATGALYAIRTNDYVTIENDTVLDDLVIPMRILRTGKHLKINSKAEMYDLISENVDNEKSRKIRTLSGNYQTFFRDKWMFNPFENIIFLQFLSHKVFRLFIPYFLILLLASNVFLYQMDILYKLFLIFQLAFYTSYIAARNYNWARKIMICSFALVFVELNISAVQGLYMYLRNQSSVLWEKND